jgi:hypothetical protein
VTLARRHARDFGFVAGGALLVISSLCFWVSSGAGSTLRGHALIDAIESLSHGHSSAWTTVLTLVWYAVPACGALAWIVVGFGDPQGPSGRALAIATAVIVATIDVYFFAKVGSRAGLGVYLAAAGALTLTLAAVPMRRLTCNMQGKRRIRESDRGQALGTSRSS